MSWRLASRWLCPCRLGFKKIEKQPGITTAEEEEAAAYGAEGTARLRGLNVQCCSSQPMNPELHDSDGGSSRTRRLQDIADRRLFPDVPIPIKLHGFPIPITCMDPVMTDEACHVETTDPHRSASLYNRTSHQSTPLLQCLY